jgi:hypothetical protein
VLLQGRFMLDETRRQAARAKRRRERASSQRWMLLL